MTDDPHQYAESQRRENLVEHCFAAELHQDAWVRRSQILDILRNEVDAAGYDLVLFCNGITRHVQLKSSKSDAITKAQPINGRLADVPSGCVVWIWMKEDHAANRVKLEYWFYGNAPGKPLEALRTLPKAKHKSKASGKKAERSDTFKVGRQLFVRLAGIEQLSDLLFGPPRRQSDSN